MGTFFIIEPGFPRLTPGNDNYQFYSEKLSRVTRNPQLKIQVTLSEPLNRVEFYKDLT